MVSLDSLLGPAPDEAPDETPDARRMRPTTNRGPADAAFRGVVRTSGFFVLVIMVLVGSFLLYRAWKALRVSGLEFLTTQSWEPDGGRFGIAAVIVGTVLIALVAIGAAAPLA